MKAQYTYNVISNVDRVSRNIIYFNNFNNKNIMKITKNSLITFLALILTIGSYGSVLADSRDSGDGGDGVSIISTTSLDVKSEMDNNDNNGDNLDNNESDNSTSSQKVDSEEKDSEDNGTSTEGRHHSKSDEHKSEIAKFVHGLSKIADEEGGIGKEVRDIADEEDNSSASTTEAISKVESRNSFETFLIGSDFKNLGMLRSELARTGKLIDRLNVLASSTASTNLQTDLVAQIKLLQDDQAKVQAFVTANENSFSLFGWFVKFFNK